MRTSTRWMLIPTLLALAACDPGPAPDAPEVGTMRVPLTATGSSGGSFRLDPARFRITGPGVNRVVDGSLEDVLDVDLEPGNYLVRLLDDWTLQEDTGEGFAPVDAVLQSANPQPLEIAVGEVTDVVFVFGVGDDAIAFGEGRGRIRIEVDEGAPAIPEVGTSGDFGVEQGADWEVCRADEDTAWVSTQNGGGTYDTTAICEFLGYAGVDEFGGTCDMLCGYCGTLGDETYDGAGAGFPDAFRTTVHWRCTNTP